MPGEDLATIDVPFRFKVVNAVPVSVVAVTVGGLVLAGAPADEPKLSVLLDTARGYGWAGAVLALAVIVVVALLAEPLEIASIRFLEGYWSFAGPLRPIATAANWLQRRRHSRLLFFSAQNQNRPLAQQAAQALRRFPPRPNRILPTSLGNRLRGFEDRAGTAYGIKAVAWWPRLHHALPESVLNSVNQYRNQLDVAVRLGIAFAVCAVATFGLLVRQPSWWWMPAVFVALAWFAYRGALGAADTYGVAVTAAIDVYHLRLLQEMRIEIPQDTNAERAVNRQLDRLWRGIGQANVRYSTTDSDHKIEIK